ncbi:hypothetical protein [Sodalis praecaptivus]|uniref:hypothetical protein n=1 Tax=Sodalis TaxID=84565 RepID=UPI00046D7BB3|nr:hypothetical protein [Sodalis praecaptivus]
MKKLIMLALSAACSLVTTGSVFAADATTQNAAAAQTQTCVQHQGNGKDPNCMKNGDAPQSMMKSDKHDGTMMMKPNQAQQGSMMMKKNDMNHENAGQ